MSTSALLCPYSKKMLRLGLGEPLCCVEAKCTATKFYLFQASKKSVSHPRKTKRRHTAHDKRMVPVKLSNDLKQTGSGWSPSRSKSRFGTENSSGLRMDDGSEAARNK